jgi:hypothetical protein
MTQEKAFDIARQVRKLVLARVEVHDDMEHPLELEESLYRALAEAKDPAPQHRVFSSAASRWFPCASQYDFLGSRSVSCL